jgi:hypothetical protein
MIVSRNVTHNAPLYDGTPRHEKGFRAFVERRVPITDQPWYWADGAGTVKQVCQSPLVKTRAEAEEWLPQ